jgi:hypothetical protein
MMLPARIASMSRAGSAIISLDDDEITVVIENYVMLKV